jgi:predicted NBD/HSP70 family sugar kinase
MLGLELRDSGAIAIVVDEQGRIDARAEMSVADGLGDCARAAVELVARPGAASSEPLGIAAWEPDSLECGDAVTLLATRWPAATTTENVARSGTAAAMAEAWIGAARGSSDVVFFGVADHVQAGIVRKGHPVCGAHGNGAAVRWFALNPVDREDYRRLGCLESEVSSAGIVKRFIWRIKAGDNSRVGDAVDGDLAAITAARVLQAARDDDGGAVSVVRDTARYLGMAAANLVALIDPEVLVLGGIMSSSADLLLEPVRAEIARRLPKAMLGAVRIVPASLAGDAAAIGAARMASGIGR